MVPYDPPPRVGRDAVGMPKVFRMFDVSKNTIVTILNRKKNLAKKNRTRPEQGKTHATEEPDKARTSKSLKKALFRGFVHGPRGGRAQNLRTRLTEKVADKAGTAAHFAGILR